MSDDRSIWIEGSGASIEYNDALSRNRNPIVEPGDGQGLLTQIDDGKDRIGGVEHRCASSRVGQGSCVVAMNMDADRISGTIEVRRLRALDLSILDNLEAIARADNLLVIRTSNGVIIGCAARIGDTASVASRTISHVNRRCRYREGCIVRLLLE